MFLKEVAEVHKTRPRCQPTDQSTLSIYGVVPGVDFISFVLTLGRASRSPFTKVQ